MALCASIAMANAEIGAMAHGGFSLDAIILCMLAVRVALCQGCSVVFFFFQAEDGIRDLTVTGVQTCALPILTQVGRFTEPPAGDWGQSPLPTPLIRPVVHRFVPQPRVLRLEHPVTFVREIDRKSVV